MTIEESRLMPIPYLIKESSIRLDLYTRNCFDETIRKADDSGMFSNCYAFITKGHPGSAYKIGQIEAVKSLVKNFYFILEKRRVLIEKNKSQPI